MSIFDTILKPFGLGSEPVDVEGLIPGVEQGYDDAEESLNQGYNEALSYLEVGNAEAADEILKGLGFAIDEREKWFDVATKALQPVIEFGREYEQDARQFMDYAKELVFNPDAIYGTQMWESLKGQMVESITNSSSAKSGLLSGNYLDEVGKRVMSLGAGFRDNEIRNALGGFNSAMMPVQMGFGAQGQIAGNAMNVGAGNAADYMRAYGQIGGNEFSTGANMATTANQFGQSMAGLDMNQASSIADMQLTQQLANQNASAQNTSAILGTIGSFLPYVFGGNRGSEPTTTSGFGGAVSPDPRASTYYPLNPFR